MTKQEFIVKIATQFTRLKFHEDTFDMYVERNELGFTEEAQVFFNERYDEIEKMYNNIIEGSALSFRNINILNNN